MKVFLGIKHFDDNRNRQFIEQISNLLSRKGHETINSNRDLEKWGAETLPSKELMQNTFNNIDNADVVLLEMSTKGVGLGIEAGYAFAKGKPIISVAEAGKAPLSKSLQGISSETFVYHDLTELDNYLSNLDLA